MMRLRKTFILSLAVFISMLFCTNIFASSLSRSIIGGDITPYWTAMIQPYQSFGITSGKATIGAETIADTNASSVYVSADLQQYKNGNWVTIKSWTNTKIGSYVNLSQNWYVTSGYTYRLVTYHITYFGGQSESTTLTSRSISY